MTTQRITFPGHSGETLSARLDLPAGAHLATAIFAHCFTCGKDIPAARRIAARLAGMGIAVLRFDFTGLGHSEGEFANTSFTSNVDDLVVAATYLTSTGMAPTLLIGHSLGGAAVLKSANKIIGIKAESDLVLWVFVFPWRTCRSVNPRPNHRNLRRRNSELFRLSWVCRFVFF